MKRYKIYITLDTLYDMSYECEVKMCEIFFSDWNFVLYSVQKVCSLQFETKYTSYRSYIVIQSCNTIQDNRIRFSNYKTKFTLQQHNASGMNIVQSKHLISQKNVFVGQSIVEPSFLSKCFPKKLLFLLFQLNSQKRN